MTQNISFKNWTSSVFVCKFGGQNYTFEAGKTYSIPSEVAPHFSHHLAVKELNSSKDEKDHAFPPDKLNDYINRCFPNSSLSEIEGIKPTMSFEMVDESVEDKPAPQENKTDSDVQKEVVPVDENVRDNKVVKKMGRPKKVVDEEYTK